MEHNVKLRMIRQRAKALYHNCNAAACFAYSDSDKIDNDNDPEAIALRRSAQAYESVGEWIRGLIDII